MASSLSLCSPFAAKAMREPDTDGRKPLTGHGQGLLAKAICGRPLHWYELDNITHGTGWPARRDDRFYFSASISAEW
jgi:hypothetical protein